MYHTASSAHLCAKLSFNQQKNDVQINGLQSVMHLKNQVVIGIEGWK
jgi:hypothetical protein